MKHRNKFQARPTEDEDDEEFEEVKIRYIPMLMNCCYEFIDRSF